MIAPWIHDQFEQAAFLTLLAPPSLTGHRVLSRQKARIADVAGAPAADVDSIRERARRIFDILRSDRDSVVVASRLRAFLGDGGEEDGAPQSNDRLQLKVEANTSPWFIDFARYDPRPALRQVDVPILVLFGTQDLLVPPRHNAPPMRTALGKSPADDTAIRVLEGLNHWMQSAKTGRPSEVAEIETTLAPEVLRTLIEWIRERTSEGE